MALNCHNNFFQVRNSMHIKDRTDNKIMKVFGAAFFFCAICYYVVARMGVALYGD